MTRDVRLLLFFVLLMMHGLLSVESRYREHEDTSVVHRQQHRHRHRHDGTWTNSRNRYEPIDRKSSSWSQDLEYEYDDDDDDVADNDDSNLEEYEDELDDDDYDSYRENRPLLSPYPTRNNHHSRNDGYHRGKVSSRYRHRNGRYHSEVSYHNEEKDKKRYHRLREENRFSRNRYRSGTDIWRSRNRELGIDFPDDESQGYEEEEFDHERSRNDRRVNDAYYTSRRSSKKHHRNNWRREWKNRYESERQRYSRNGRRIINDRDDFEGTRRKSQSYDTRKTKGNLNLTKSKIKLLNNDGKNDKDGNLADYKEILESLKASSEREKEEDDVGGEIENEDDDDDDDDENEADVEEEDDEDEEEGDNGDDDGDDDVDDDNDNNADDEIDDDEKKELKKKKEEEEEEELDNDFYKNEKKPPLNTFDDIIRRLTSDDPITIRPKRDYRNIWNENYPKRIINHHTNNSRFHHRQNMSRVSRDHSQVLLHSSRPSYAGESVNHNKTYQKSIKNVDERFSRKKTMFKSNDNHERQAKTKSLEQQQQQQQQQQDYDEYLNTDNEKEEDLIKAGVDVDSNMQSDVTNTDYGEDDSTDIQETSATTTTMTTARTTTTTTTTTPKPVVTQHFDYRDPRAYDSSTGNQYNGYQSKKDYPPMSAHSVHKWQSLGTRESVKETRGNMQQYNKNGKNAEIKEAIQHAIKVSREGSCQWPRPRVIPVRDVYPSPSITYIPHCAILHRCSDDTGCCRSEALTCVPKHSHRVELSFYTTNVSGSSVVEKLSFYNHTECECKEKTEYESAEEKPLEQRFYRHYQTPSQPQNMRREPPKKSCRCPSEFTPRITPDGECQCNCYDHNQNCIKTRRGKGYFSLSDRFCIQNNECAMPNCEFGEYMKREGKCPRKRDKFDAIANFRTNLNHRYRS